MKMLFGEFKPDYSNYHFPYQVWLFKEDGDNVEKIYANGFLPIRSIKNVYYLSRNVRVDLNKFELSSENRRVLKKTENIKADLVSLVNFHYSPKIQKFCKDYGINRLGKGFFSTAAIRNIFSGNVYNSVLLFEDINTQETVGYAVCYISENILQYAHSFYDLRYLKESLGARMILEGVRWAKENQKGFAYLGTCYEKSSLYKTEFKGVEFFNGFRWSDDLEELKELVKKGLGGNKWEVRDYLLRDKEYLEKFYQGDLLNILDKFGIRVNF